MAAQIKLTLAALLLAGFMSFTARAEDDPIQWSPVDMILRVIDDPDRPCVRFVDSGGRGWYVSEVTSIHRSLRSLRLKPGQQVRVVGWSCEDCLAPRCGIFAGYLFDVRLVPPRRGDINADGDVNMMDVATVMNAWGPCPEINVGCPADVNRDGAVDARDLLDLLRIVHDDDGKRVRLHAPGR
jgi:hypothetical protein